MEGAGHDILLYDSKTEKRELITADKVESHGGTLVDPYYKQYGQNIITKLKTNQQSITTLVKGAPKEKINEAVKSLSKMDLHKYKNYKVNNVISHDGRIKIEIQGYADKKYIPKGLDYCYFDLQININPNPSRITDITVYENCDIECSQ